MVFPQYMKINTFYHPPLLRVSEKSCRPDAGHLSSIRARAQGGLEGIFQQGAEHIKQVLRGRLMPQIIKTG